MKSTARCLASALVSLAALHTAPGLPLDTQRDEPANEALFPMTRAIEGASPLTALLQPRFEASALREPSISPPTFTQPRDAANGASLLEVNPGAAAPSNSPEATTAPREYYFPSPTLEALLLPPDSGLWNAPHCTGGERKGLDSSPMGLGDLPIPNTIPEPRSASLLAIGLAGLGLRACWDVRRRGR